MGKELSLHERLEYVQDILAAVPETEREHLKDWVEETKRDQQRLAQDAVEAAIKDLKNASVKSAAKKLKEAINSLELTTSMEWEIGKWLAISAMIETLQSKNFMKISDADQVISHFLDKWQSPPPQFGDEIREFDNWLTKVEEIFNVGNKIRRETNISKQLVQYRNLLSEFGAIRSTVLFQVPDQTLSILKKQIPLLDEKELESQASTQAGDQAREIALRQLKDNIRRKIQYTSTYPAEEINTLFVEANIELDTKLKVIEKVHNHLNIGEIIQAMELISNEQSDLFSNYRRILENIAKNWLIEKEAGILYFDDITKILQLKDFVTRGAVHLTFSESLNSRIELYHQSDTESLEYLNKCQATRIEPWLRNMVDNNGYSTNELLRYKQINKFSDEVEALKQGLAEKLGDNYIKELNDALKYLDEKTTRFDSLQKELNEKIETSRFQREEVLKAIDDGLVQIEGFYARLEDIETQKNKIENGLEEADQRLLDAHEDMIKMVDKIGSSKRIKPLLEEDNLYYNLLTSAGKLVVFAALGACHKGDFNTAFHILQSEKESWDRNDVDQTAPPPQKQFSGSGFDTVYLEMEMIEAEYQTSHIWILEKHKKEITQDNEKREIYQTWFDAIHHDNAKQSYNCYKKIENADNGKPLFEYLLETHLTKFGSFHLNQIKWWELFKNGNFEELKYQLDQVDKISISNIEIMTWETWLDQAEKAADFLRILQSDSREKSWAEKNQKLFQAILPRHCWDAARQHLAKYP